MSFEVIQGDCLEVMRSIPDGSIDACITDPPYGTTACAWDAVIPFGPMWQQLKRVVKKDGAIVLFGSQPFTSALVMSNPQMFKYQWVWEKPRASGFMNANYQPLKAHEDICVFSGSASSFSPSGAMAYSPQMKQGEPYTKRGEKIASNGHAYHAKSIVGETVNPGTRYPRSVIRFDNHNSNSMHATAKPVELMRYLVRTYTNAGETILDFTCGSGSTGVACVIEGRRFIGIEQGPHYCEVSRARIARASGQAVDIPRAVRPEKELPLFTEAVA